MDFVAAHAEFGNNVFRQKFSVAARNVGIRIFNVQETV